MIVVTKLNDSRFALNPDLIERIHQTPDTTIVLLDGAQYIVTESMDEVIDMIAGYRARIIGLARAGQRFDDEHSDRHPILGLVPDPDARAEDRASGAVTGLPHRGGRA